jgi:hypothetical protein
MNDFLQSEEEIINKARTLLEQADGMHESARPQYAELLKARIPPAIATPVV